MKTFMNYGLMPLLTITLLLSACASPPSVHPVKPAPAPIAVTATMPAAISAQFAIKEATLRYMFAQAATENERKEYSAYAIDDKTDGGPLAAAFADHVPPVFNTITVVNAGGMPVNQATGKHVKVWSVKIVSISDVQAVVTVESYYGNLGAEFSTVHLQRNGNAWIVQSNHLDMMS